MEDILELDVHENEFINEGFSVSESGKNFGGKNLTCTENESSKQTAVQDSLAVDKAKQELLEKVKDYEGELGSNIDDNASKVVKNRVPVKMRLGVRDNDVEMLDCDEEEGREDHLENKSTQYNNKAGFKGGGTYRSKDEDVPRRPTMTKLCKRLHVKWHHSPEKIGKEIAERLEEPKFCLIINIVKTIGGGKAIELFKETREIQINGGMHTANGTRRKTSGGVFLTLLKNKFATEEEVKKIFREDAKHNIEALKRKRTLQRQKKREKERQKKAEEDSKMCTETQIGDEKQR